jgi:AraC family transcriptional regulator
MGYTLLMAAYPQTIQHRSAPIADVLRYIRQHIDEPLDREALADVAGFSVPHFHRIFTTEVGESAIAYVRRQRLERAGRKLRMGAVDITEVAHAAGYETHAAFARAFRAHFGVSPREFRQLGCAAATRLLNKGEAT